MKSLQEKVVVITGAGSGIGRALAVEASRRGAHLAISDVNEAGLDETVSLIKAASNAEVRADRLDVADRAAFLAYADTVAEHFGRVNVIINNAGVTMTGDFEDMTLDEFDWIMGINLNGVVTGTKAFLPHLIASGDGQVVNISSVFGLVSMPGQSAYNASKYAVRGFSEALREEMLISRHPVGVTCVHPGGIKTGIARNGRKTAGQNSAAIDRLFEEKLARMSPEKAADIILGAVQRNQARILVGIDAHVLHTFGKLAGSRYQDVVALASKRIIPAKKR
jgi:NAD(P)-dependent dehydrogenase (short-subunit alcohol dehydrogenase family)